ncbi:MAG: VOC family protein [Armatimonadetes bacterium]|nr:VOC family protein [Armatimonadota bacterium]
MKLGHLEFFCRDCFKTYAFYVDVLGFEFVTVQDETFVWMRLDELEILLRPGEPPKPTLAPTSGSSFVLYVDDLMSLEDKLSELDVEILTSEENPELIAFQDPDGRWIQAKEAE